MRMAELQRLVRIGENQMKPDDKPIYRGCPGHIRDERDVRLVVPQLWETIRGDFDKLEKPPFPYDLEVSYKFTPIEK